jgi:hypothetical protein
VLHAKVQLPPWHVACACATVVVQVRPHMPQLLALFIVSTQVLLQRVGALAEHPVAHE